MLECEILFDFIETVEQIEFDSQKLISEENDNRHHLIIEKFNEFINLYKQGYIYKGTRMVNWCPKCHTAISDVEVEYKEEISHLWHLRYKIKGEDRYVEVATTRPETIALSSFS